MAHETVETVQLETVLLETVQLETVQLGRRVVGFIEVVGPVFVGLMGERYDVAEEVAQKLSRAEALAAVLASVPGNIRTLPLEGTVHEVTRKRRPVAVPRERKIA